MKKIIIILICIPFLLSGKVRGPVENLDETIHSKEKISINNKLKTLKTDNERIEFLYSLAKSLRGISIKDAEEYALQGLFLSENIRSRHYLGMGNNLMGTIKLASGQFAAADSFLNQGIRITQKNDLEINAHLNNSMGVLNTDLDKYESAYVYYQKSVELFSRLHQDSIAAIIKLNIAINYANRKDTEKAIVLSRQLIRYFESQNNKEQLIHIFNDMSNLCYGKSMLDSAEYFCRKSLNLSAASNDKDDVIQSYLNLGKINSKRKLYNISNDYLSRALLLADTLNSIQDQAEITKHLSNNYKVVSDSGKAYYYLSLFNKYEKDLQKQEAFKIQAKRELDVISKNLKSKAELFYISLACFLISLMLIITLYLNYRIKKKANRLLVEMDELKSRLFSNITHEFRTPLTLILGPLEELLSEGEKRNLTRHEIKIMRKNANRLLNLVNQMLDLAKLDAKSLKIELAEGDFVQFFKVNVMVFASLAEQKKLLFQWSVPAQPLVTYFDADKLEKIINNLISNAIKYTEKGGEVNCTLEILPDARNMVKFRVSDTGKGISGEHLPRIFDRFYQAEGTPGPDSYGTGIGLSLTKELITLLHGEITAESESGKGSRFTVTLPLGYKHLKSEEYIITESGRNDKLKSREPEVLQDAEYPAMTDREMNVDQELPLLLIVEDQSDLRNYLTGHLKDSYRLIESENGRQGFDQAIQNLPDLVITDLVMPEMDGLEFCGKLKTDEKTGHIPVIMLTARTGLEEKMAGLETGADQYLTKPFHMKELRLIIRKLIEQRLLLRKRFSRDVKLEPKDIAITSADEKFLNRALAVIDKHMGDFDFDVNTLQEEMAMSRMQLFRKIKALTDQTPGDFIRTIRLKRAERLIAQGFGNMAQVTFEVGFNNPSYFAKCFREMYGVLPSEYAKRTNLKARAEKSQNT